MPLQPVTPVVVDSQAALWGAVATGLVTTADLTPDGKLRMSEALCTACVPAVATPKIRGCKHYARGCKLRSPCCGELFSCRFCHDAAKSEGEPNPQAKHNLNRHLVRSVVCLECETEQPPDASCIQCSAVFGAYFCKTCNLYDDDLTKQQFHCEKCGICRVGGRDNFFHCETCGACYSVELRNNHVCVPNSMQRDCPICYEYLFDSLEAPQVRAHPPSAKIHTLHACTKAYGRTKPCCAASPALRMGYTLRPRHG